MGEEFSDQAVPKRVKTEIVTTPRLSSFLAFFLEISCAQLRFIPARIPART
jgi:hypothetical protein